MLGMKKLSDYEEEIYKCSRCGLCQSVCPVYRAALNECCVSKAKFTMLNGVIKGDLKLNKRIKDYMDLCTGCNACKDFCPSNIDAREIFTAVKAQYYAENGENFAEKILDSYFLFKTMLVCAKIAFSLYRFFSLSKIASLFTGILPKRLVLLDSLISEKEIKAQKAPQKSQKAVYFAGCFNNYLNPSTKNALKNIFAKTGVEIIEKGFECCGISYLSAGKFKKYEKLAKKNLEKLPEDYDFVLTDCASCNFALREYAKYFPCEKSEKLAQKTVNVLEFLKDKKIVAKKPLKITAHKPCHEDFDFISIIKSIENAEYEEAEDFDKCCGFSGKFALKNLEISRKIAKSKAEKFINTNADLIITTCPACELGIRQGLIEIDKKTRLPVMNLVEFISEFCDIY